MGKVLDSKKTFEKAKVYKQSRVAYLFYYLITFSFLFLAVFIKWNNIFRIGCFVIFILFSLYFEIHIIRNHLIVDDKKVEIRIGFFHILTKSVPLAMVSDIRVKQNLFQRIFHYGVLELNTGGGEFYELKMEKLRNPVKVKEDIEERLHKLQIKK